MRGRTPDRLARKRGIDNAITQILAVIPTASAIDSKGIPKIVMN
jgi:hypothetical protein